MTYRFGEYTLDPARCQLTRGGDEMAVEPQVFDLLRLLIENRDRVVSRDDLIATVWDGRIVSEATMSSRIAAARRAVGDTGKRQAVIRTMSRRGFRFVATLATEEGAVPAPDERPPAPARRQRIRFCTSRGGTRLAFATTGSGYPLVRAGHWLTHLDHDWHSPVWRPFLDALGERFEVTRYDQRGNGLSDWSVGGFGFDRFVDDLEAVADAAGVERFALYGTSQGAPISIAYAVRHPTRVSHLILHGGFAQGRLVRSAIEEREQGEAVQTLIRHGWGRPGSPFLKAFTAMFIPDATMAQLDSLVELQRRTTTPENAARLRAAADSFDVTPLLPQVTVPTLVVHARHDGVHPLEEGRKLAAGIANAEFVMLESANHVILEHEPARSVLFASMRDFVLD